MNQTTKSELTGWVRQYTKDLLARAYQKTSDYRLSEDLVQETFLAAAENIASFKRQSQPKTWLNGILKNKIAEHYRKKLQRNITHSVSPEQLNSYFNENGHWIKNQRPQSWTESENLTDIPAFNKILDKCIENLPAAMNACIRLKFLDEKKGTQICQELDISTTNYWQIIHRAKLQLRNCLDMNWFKG